jgi:hypothetical protein
LLKVLEQCLDQLDQKSVTIAFATIDLDNIGKIHSIWGREAAGYIIKLYEQDLEAFLSKYTGEVLVYARGDEFELISLDYTSQELKSLLEEFKYFMLGKHTNTHYVQLSRHKTGNVYRGNNFKFLPYKNEGRRFDTFNDGVLFFPGFSGGIAQGDFSVEENIISITDALRFFATLAINDAKTQKGTIVIFSEEIEINSSVSPRYDFANIENKVKKYKKKLKRNINIDDHHIELMHFDQLMARNPYSAYKKYLLIEFLWYGPALDDLKAKGFEMRGSADGYGLKGMIKLVDPNTLYYVIAQNMDSAVDVLRKYRINERHAKMTRFLDKMEVYFNISIPQEKLVQIADEISAAVNKNLVEVPFDVNCRVFMTFRRASNARKGASFRSYIEYVSKVDVIDDSSWKTYTPHGNILAVYNSNIKSKIVEIQHTRAGEAYQKMVELGATLTPVL